MVKVFGQIFGGFYALFGAIVSIFDILDWADLVKTFPQLPNVNELVYGHIVVFFIGLFLAIFGGYIFVKSR